jgi:hypothetical protein
MTFQESPWHDSRSGFSAGLRRTVNMPSPDTHKPPPWCSGFTPLPLLLHPPPCACDSTWPPSLTRRLPAEQTPALFTVLSYTIKTANFQIHPKFLFLSAIGPIVVVWQPNDFILPHGRANGNWASHLHFPPAFYINPWRWRRCSSETSANCQRTTRRYTSEDSILHNHRCENLKPYIPNVIQSNKWCVDTYKQDMNLNGFKTPLHRCKRAQNLHDFHDWVAVERERI